jgi:hypothetical protein
MKSRPRSVERKVAEYLTKVFSDVGMSPVERIPVLGRTGPDITINEARFAIDVKSRLSVPKGIFPSEGTTVFTSEPGYRYVGIELENLISLLNKRTQDGEIVDSFTSVKNWYEHMKEWTLSTRQISLQYIPALVLHRPGMAIKKSLFIISIADYESMPSVAK